MPEDFPDVVVEVWPDNWAAVEVFASMATQWATAANGVIGLRYESFAQVRTAHGVSDSEWPEMFYALRVMEQAALEVLRKTDG